MASSSNTSSSSSSSSAAGGGFGAPLYSAPGAGVGGTAGAGGAGGAGQGSSSGPAGPSPGNKYQCPNCGKAFSRDDLLRRHLAREARAMAQPQFDRQKSCFECARSKARCDLEVPSCGRCRARGKHCVYGARSGNPNVRRQRDSANPPANLAGMTIATGPHHGDMGVGPTGGSPFAWAPGGDAAYYSDSSHGSIPTTPGSIHSGDESSSDSGAGWADASQVPYGGPRTHGYTASSASLPIQPSVGPYAGVPGPISGPSHGIPQGMGGSVDQAPVVTPTTYMTRHSHDPSMPSGGRLITDLDRSAPAYKTEDGEETPIGRIVSSFAAGPSSMSARAPESDFDPRSRSVMGPPTHLPSHPQHHPHQQHPMMQQQQQHAGPSHHFQQQQHQPPHQPHALPHGAHSSHQQQQLPPSGWIPPPQNPYAPMSSSPLHHHHAGGGASQLMGPPLGLPHRSTASMGPTTTSGGGDGSAAGHFASPTRSRSQQRPQPHRLLTGAAMPQPPPSMTGNNAGAGGMHMPPPSGKPLFSAMVDLSGWLEDPVVPSPLYPTGPSMAPFAPSGAEPGTSGVTGGDITSQQQQQPQASLDTMMQSDEDSTQQQQQQQPDATSQPSSQMPASRYWWAHPPSQSDYTLMQGVAQASANHLSHYPALMVLPEPSSPVPPTVHRPWMAMMRGAIPPYLAIARVVLAGYAVRLPASEAVVWESVGRETRRIVECHEAICSRATSDLDVFGATQSLFFYCILLMMCNDAGAVGHVDVALTNSAFFGLSQLAKTLSGRVQVAQQQLQQQQGGDSKAGTADEWMEWGFVETMRRTVWAAYAMLVLQRYRDSADMSQGRLAGVDLILDLELPAPALEFEAGTLEDWNKARAALYGGGQTEDGDGVAAGAEAGNNGHGRPINRPTLTFRDLLRYRPSSSSSTGNGIDTTTSNVDATATQGNSADPTPPTTSSSTSSLGAAAGAGGAPKELLDYFERHDAFVATVLSIAFCLDASLTAA